MQVELLPAPDCPNAAAARAVVTECLDRLGLAVPVRERMGDYASPTILVDGVDVLTEAQGTPAMQACRLNVPTEARVLQREPGLRAPQARGVPGLAIPGF